MTNLTLYLKQHGVYYEFIAKPTTLHTRDAAKTTGIPLERIVKSLVCIGDDRQAYIAIIAGDRMLRIKEVAKAFKLKEARLCAFEEAHRYSGYVPGATPPIHYHNIKGVVVDLSLTSYEEIYGGGGTKDRLLKIRLTDIIRLNNALVRDISYVVSS